MHWGYIFIAVEVVVVQQTDAMFEQARGMQLQCRVRYRRCGWQKELFSFFQESVAFLCGKMQFFWTNIFRSCSNSEFLAWEGESLDWKKCCLFLQASKQSWLNLKKIYQTRFIYLFCSYDLGPSFFPISSIQVLIT